MTKITTDEARDVLVEATAHYESLERALAESVAGEGTPERVIRTIELEAALVEAAQGLVAAKQTFEKVATENAERRRDRARAELVRVEAELLAAVAEAEARLEALAATLAGLMDMSKRRYAFRQEATGRAPRSLLARNAVEGWLSWRLQGLDLPGLDNPPHHYRAPLAELLGLDTSTDTGDTE